MTFSLKTITSLVLFTAIVPATTRAQEAPKSPPWNQADAVYGAEAMAKPRHDVQAGGGDQRTYYLQFNQLETQLFNHENTFYWNGMAWYGGDLNKLWIKSEGRASLEGNGVDDAEIQVLYSRAISPFWNLQGGVRYDFKPTGLTHGVIALNGLAPYWFEVDTAAFISEKGDLTARLEFEYDLLLTQRLILQPRIEINLSAQDIPERNIASGLNNIDAGLRLRYEFHRQFAPYIGVDWQNAFGKTNDMIKADGGHPNQVQFVAGIRTWF